MDALSLPLTITDDAAAYIAERGIKEPFQRMLDNIPRRIPFVHAVSVSLQEPYDLGGDPRVVLDVSRDHPGSLDDPAERQWIEWVVKSFTADDFQHFALLSSYTTSNARQSVS